MSYEERAINEFFLSELKKLYLEVLKNRQKILSQEKEIKEIKKLLETINEKKAR